MTSKSELRQAFRLRLSEGEVAEPLKDAQSADPASSLSDLAAGAASDSNDKLGARLESLFATERFANGIWAAFQPIGHEPDIRPALMSLEFRRSIEWAYPRVEGNELEFYLPDDPAVFTENKWGILEPDPATSRKLELGELSGVLIPALAFDFNCNRLGRGGGFYDRALARIQIQNTTTIKIGIGFDRQLSETSLPVEAFDVPMDWVVTETRAFARAGITTKPDLKMGRKPS